MAEAPAITKDFHVLCTLPDRKPGFHSGFEIEEQAQHAADTANETAKTNGYTARYSVVPKSASPFGS